MPDLQVGQVWRDESGQDWPCLLVDGVPMLVQIRIWADHSGCISSSNPRFDFLTNSHNMTLVFGPGMTEKEKWPQEQ